MAQFMLLPSFMLSGFMFLFKGMPVLGTMGGRVLPTTHALRIARGMLLKGNGFYDIAADLWPTALFTLVAAVVATWLLGNAGLSCWLTVSCLHGNGWGKSWGGWVAGRH